MSDIAHLKNLISKGHYAQARIRAEELLPVNPDITLKQLYALSLSKSGLPEAALEYLESLSGDKEHDPETMGILGGVYKELFKKNQSPKYAILSRDTYNKNFELTKNYYTGINAATMSTLAGQSKRGREIAQQVLSVLKDPEHDYWEAVTEAEAYLLMKERSKAEQLYRKASKMADTDWGKIGSVYNQLWLLNHYLPVPAGILKAFSPPVITAFIGHMIDHPDREHPRFPASLEQDIKHDILNVIRTLNSKIGYCSLACGGDILFAEAMEEAGGEVNLFLPFKEADFLEASVRFAGEGWVQRFARLVDKYPVTCLTEESYDEHPDLFLLQSNIIFGLAVLRSAAHHQEPTLVSVLSERDQKRRIGGTRHTLGSWPFKKNHVNINPDIYLNNNSEVVIEQEPFQKPATDRPVLYLVACDFYSEEKWITRILTDDEFSSLPLVAMDIRNDYGIAGFKTIFTAMEFCDWILKNKTGVLQSKNLIRMSLHAGPVYVVPDQQQQKLSGPVVDVIEQVHKLTTPGSIYATAFAAAVLSLDRTKYSFDFIDTLTVADKTKLNIFRMKAAPTLRV
jgi:tetratricopeptide (TPR) repeat protein